jgi:phosphoribosylpyrophosphate synthetase
MSMIITTLCCSCSKGDQKDGQRVPISSKLVADLLKMAGAKHLMMLDPHTPQLEGFFGTPVDALKVSNNISVTWSHGSTCCPKADVCHGTDVHAII